MPKETSKPTRSRGKAASSPQPGLEISAEERERMIREAAYQRAQQRGFEGGEPTEDWLAAEREINRAFPSSKQQKEELAAYEKLREQAQKLLGKVRDTVDAQAVREALDKAGETLSSTGKYTAETLAKVRDSLRKDVASAAARMGPRWEAFSEKSADVFGVWRDRSQVFLATGANAVAEWLRQASDRLETHPIYKTGEMAAPGMLQCIGCGERVELATAAHVPMCAKCRKMEFRRIA